MTYQPVSDGRNAHTSGTCFQGPDFGSVNPANRSESKSIDDDEKIGEGDNCVSGWTGDSDQDVLVAVDTLRDVHTMRSQNTTNNEVAEGHSQSAVNQ